MRVRRKPKRRPTARAMRVAIRRSRWARAVVWKGDIKSCLQMAAALNENEGRRWQHKGIGQSRREGKEEGEKNRDRGRRAWNKGGKRGKGDGRRGFDGGE